MITKSNLIYYASVSQGTTILAEFNSKDADLAALAVKCLHNAPPHHTTFSHTIRKRTYTFLIDDPFVYFAINDENLDNLECLVFLRSVKEAFDGIGVVAGEKLTSHCFQGEFSPIFHQLLASETEAPPKSPPGESSVHSRDGSLDSPRGKRIGSVPLLGGEHSKALKKKRRQSVEGNGHDHSHGRDGVSPENKTNSNLSGDAGAVPTRDLSVSMQKGNGLFPGEAAHQRAKVWKKHVWVVLSLDLIVCCILFAIWLWVCRGFKCIDE